MNLTHTHNLVIVHCIFVNEFEKIVRKIDPKVQTLPLYLKISSEKIEDIRKYTLQLETKIMIILTIVSSGKAKRSSYCVYYCDKSVTQKTNNVKAR